MNIPDEAVEAADRAAFPGLPAGMSAEEARRRVTRAVQAAAPLIAAQVLRRVARALEEGCEEEIRGMDSGYVDGYRSATGHAVRALRTIADQGVTTVHENGPECFPDPEPAHACPRCGSPQWVSVSLDEGYTRHAQCVPCGTMHPGVIGPGWRAT